MKDPTNQTIFFASKELSEKIKKLQEELHLDSPGKVIAMGLSFVELALGRDVEITDENKRLKISKFKNHRQTISLDDREIKGE